jgi:hypothetical protein
MLVSGFSNADWAGCDDDRRSNRDFAIFLESCFLEWKKTTQNV